MKKLLSTLALAALTCISWAQVPAFPGAEGHGRYVTGGRGGEVRHVTTLNDDGNASTVGTFRWAVSGSSKKIVVFDVAGIIELTKDLEIGENTTIAGQTAPAPGITLRYYTVRPKKNNIIRFIRFRRGEERNVNDGADASWQRETDGIILDHCSFSWSIDELASFYDNAHFTMQWCTLGEALANPGHTKGEHSYGGIWGGKGASFHHNFLCHMQNRVPRFCGARYNWEGYDKTAFGSAIEAEIVDFRNCVMYNWGNGNGCYGGTGGGNINIVNNYYKAGPGTANKTRVTQVSVATSSNASGTPFMGYCCRYYINGNYVTAAGSNAENYDWAGVIYDSGTSTINGERYCPDANHLYGPNVTYVKNANNIDCVKIKMDSPVDAGEVTTHTAQNAFVKVLAYGGASLHRDAVDARYMEEAQTGTTHYTGSATKQGDGSSITHRAGIIDFVSDQGTYTLESTSRPAGFDTDKDGMPDEWETANGLNPNDATDAKTYTLDTTKQWYTNLEVYLNSLVQDIMIGGNADAMESVNEYYPTYKKEDGTVVEVGKDDTNQGEQQEQQQTYTVSFNGSDVITPSGSSFFSFKEDAADKHNFNTKFTGSYNGTTFTQGLKMETSTKVLFTTTAVGTVTIVQSTWSEGTIAFDGTELAISSATTPAGSNGVRVYTIQGVGAGSHRITRKGDESGLFYVAVTTGSGVNGISNIIAADQLSAGMYNLRGQKVNDTYKGIVIQNGRKYIRR